MLAIKSNASMNDVPGPLEVRHWVLLTFSFVMSIGLFVLAVSTHGFLSSLLWFSWCITAIPMWIYAQNRKGRIVLIAFCVVIGGYILYKDGGHIDEPLRQLVPLMLMALCYWAYWFTRETAKFNHELSLGDRIDELCAKVDAVAKRLDEKQNLGADARDDEPTSQRDKLIRKEAFQICPRYGVQDDYTVSELTRSYDRKNCRERIRLLRRIYAQHILLPYELALKAVTDSDSEVREWMAREAPYLDYSERHYTPSEVEAASDILGPRGETLTHTETVTHLYPERNLIERIKQDSDPFVRAALYENHHLFLHFGMSSLGDYGIERFWECAPLERLAMMRNKEISLELVKRVLDPQDTTLCLENEERVALAKACLVNPKVVKNGRRSREMFPAGADGWGGYTISKDAKAIWELAAKWPADSQVPCMAFKYVPAEDSVKTDAFRKCEDWFLRKTILESCLPEDERTLKLGRADADSTARSIAYARSCRMERHEIEEALRREKDAEDEWVIDVLLKNPWLGETASELSRAMEEAGSDRSDSTAPSKAEEAMSNEVSGPAISSKPQKDDDRFRWWYIPLLIICAILIIWLERQL